MGFLPPPRTPVPAWNAAALRGRRDDDGPMADADKKRAADGERNANSDRDDDAVAARRVDREAAVAIIARRECMVVGERTALCF